MQFQGWNCSGIAWGYCEYVDEQVTVLDVGICNEKHDLSYDGSYIKTLCTVSADQTYEQARAKCAAAGMNLLAINNVKVQKALQDVAGARFLDRDYARLWVNGKKDNNGTWYTTNDETHPVFHQIDWLNNDSETGACLSTLRHKKQNKMQFQGWGCSGIAWVYCEYVEGDVAKVDIGVCNERHEIFYKDSYMKTLCTVSADLTYEQANKKCRGAGMNLFVVNNAQVQEALQNVSGLRFLDREYARLWINGQKNSHGTWWSTYHKSRPLSYQLDWLNDDSGIGECLSTLRYSNHYKMQFQGWDCAGKAWGYCEYEEKRPSMQCAV